MKDIIKTHKKYRLICNKNMFRVFESIVMIIFLKYFYFRNI